MDKWQVISSSYVVDDRWLTVRADHCRDGEVDINPYYVFEYSPWVNIVALTAQAELILVRQYRHGTRSIDLELPAGAFDSSEASAVLAARRELLEETGYTGGQFTEVAQLSPNSATHQNMAHVVMATGVAHTHGQKLDRTENITVECMPLNQVPHAIYSGVFRQALHVAALYQVFARQGWLSYDFS